MVKGIIFDMKGVLVHTERFYKQQRKNFLKCMGFPALETTDFTDIDEWHIWETLVPENAEFRQELLMGYRAYQRLHPVPYLGLLNPQVPGLFAQLKGNGIKLGIASSSNRQEIIRMTESACVTKLVDYIISIQECAAYKPSPEIYLRALKGMSLTPEDVFVVEDSTNGITAAKRAGLRVYALKPRHGENIDQSSATTVIAHLSDIWGFV